MSENLVKKRTFKMNNQPRIKYQIKHGDKPGPAILTVKLCDICYENSKHITPSGWDWWDAYDAIGCYLENL